MTIPANGSSESLEASALRPSNIHRTKWLSNIFHAEGLRSKLLDISLNSIKFQQKTLSECLPSWVYVSYLTRSLGWSR